MRFSRASLLGRFPGNRDRAARRPSRRGTAVVEFALVAPVLCLVVLGIMEFGRAMMVGEMLNNAARSGCRAGTLVGMTNTNVTSTVNQCLATLTNCTTTIQVNGAAADVSSGGRGDTVSVTITVPYSSVSWLPTSSFLGGVTLSAIAVMVHE